MILNTSPFSKIVELATAAKNLDEANAALKEFRDSKYRGGKLAELRAKELEADLSEMEKAALTRLANDDPL
ncbi:4469_t:CDS:2 [Paraglomus brasilianum]|uniref:4469_t:CDS:1 n=1 Tax=Paraglomus brasilianum TaxID=144538 RepID=A0A9N9FEG5_9GLOM|nr:4469_t:CDS:2 [Paraglomus brasilianum]